MDDVERLASLVINLTNQVALSNYRIALLEGASEAVASANAYTTLVATAAFLEEVEPEELSEHQLQVIQETVVKLIRSLDVDRSFN